MVAYHWYIETGVLIITKKETQEETKATGKEPKKESAIIAATMGNREELPLATFATWAASMLFILNSRIRYTIKFPIIPAEATDIPAVEPACMYV